MNLSVKTTCRTVALAVSALCINGVLVYPHEQHRKTTGRPSVQKKDSDKTDARREDIGRPADYSVKIHYDEFKDVTNVSVGPLKLNTPNSPRSVNMIAVFSYPGKRLIKAVDSAMVAFQTYSPPGSFSNFEMAPEWLVIIDGQRERFGKMRYEVSKNIEVRGLVTEELRMLTTRDGITKLANGSSIRMRVGDIECSFTPEQQSEFKKFADKMVEGLGDVSLALEVLDWTYRADELGFVRATVTVRNPTKADNDSAQAVMTCTTATGTSLSGHRRYLGTVPAESAIETELIESFDTKERVVKCDVTFETLLDRKPIKTVFVKK